MKRTKSMVYKETVESKELTLYALNDYTLYRLYIAPLIMNLTKKAAKGIYNKDKAVDGWYTVATKASKFYSKDFGYIFSDYIFSVQDRFTTAVELEEFFHDQVFEGVSDYGKN
jgi:ABC-type phosphate/phosphonate transport system permease subunit